MPNLSSSVLKVTSVLFLGVCNKKFMVFDKRVRLGEGGTFLDIESMIFKLKNDEKSCGMNFDDMSLNIQSFMF